MICLALADSSLDSYTSSTSSGEDLNEIDLWMSMRSIYISLEKKIVLIASGEHIDGDYQFASDRY